MIRTALDYVSSTIERIVGRQRARALPSETVLDQCIIENQNDGDILICFPVGLQREVLNNVMAEYTGGSVSINFCDDPTPCPDACDRHHYYLARVHE